MTEEEKRTAVLVALVKEGITDLDSLAKEVVKRLPENWRPDDEEKKELAGTWFVLRVEN